MFGKMSHKQAKRQRQELRRRRPEIQAALAEQLRLLDKRCREFDQGDWGEAVDIATRMRVVFNPGGKSSPSILKSLDAQKVPILTTCEPIVDSDNILEVIGGLYTQTFAKDEHGFRYELRPLLGYAHFRAEIPASRWWEQIVQIVADEAAGTRNVYRRRDVIMGIANKDGGAHLAELIPESYDVLSRPGGIITLTTEYEDSTTIETPIAGVHLAMLRQMAYEVLNSPALLDLTDSKKH